MGPDMGNGIVPIVEEDHCQREGDTDSSAGVSSYDFNTISTPLLLVLFCFY